MYIHYIDLVDFVVTSYVSLFQHDHVDAIGTTLYRHNCWCNRNRSARCILPLDSVLNYLFETSIERKKEREKNSEKERGKERAQISSKQSNYTQVHWQCNKRFRGQTKKPTSKTPTTTNNNNKLGSAIGGYGYACMWGCIYALTM